MKIVLPPTMKKPAAIKPPTMKKPAAMKQTLRRAQGNREPPNAFQLFFNEQKHLHPEMPTHQITKSWKRLPRDFRDMYWNQSDDLSDQKVYKHGSLVYSGKEISTKLQRKYTFNNLWQRTDSGLRKSDLTRSRTGKIVSKAKIRSWQEQ